MMFRHSLYANPKDEEIITKVLAVSGRESFNKIVMTSLKEHYIRMTGESPVTILPDWKVFERELEKADDKTFKEMCKKVTQLSMIADAKARYKKTLEKSLG